MVGIGRKVFEITNKTSFFPSSVLLTLSQKLTFDICEVSFFCLYEIELRTKNSGKKTMSVAQTLCCVKNLTPLIFLHHKFLFYVR